MYVCMYVSRKQEQKVMAQLCQTYNLVEKNQSANTAAIKVIQHLVEISSCNTICLLYH